MRLTRREAMVLRYIYERMMVEPIVSVKQVAEFLGISPPSAFELLNRLTEVKGLLVRIERKGYRLSEMGASVARRVVIVHRVLEVVFHTVFGMDADCACEIASYIDHMIDLSYAKRALENLGYPAYCPHNKRIPVSEENA